MKTIVIDGIFFQLNEWSGIAKFWRTLLSELDTRLDSSRDLRVYVLARGESERLRNSQYRNIRILPFAYFEPLCALSDFVELGSLCQSVSADVFISSYYTLAYGVANIGMAYDYIPEAMGWMDNHIWKIKEIYMRSLSRCLSISRSTADLAELYYPNLTSTAEDIFYPPMSKHESRSVSRGEIRDLRQSYNLRYPYIAVIGHRSDYKNVDLLTRALQARSPNDRKLSLGVVVTSGESLTDLESELYRHHFQFGIQRVQLNADEMPSFLHAAECLFYPSLHEGFGYPIAEALVQRCPVITTGATSMAEILNHAEPGDYCRISGHDPSEALQAIISMCHSQRRGSAETASRIQEAFCQVRAIPFVERLLCLAGPECIPRSTHLESCLVQDGFLA